VTKLRANDGAVLAVYDFMADSSSIFFDGTNIWVSDQERYILWKF
jgi:hypothetical protein